MKKPFVIFSIISLILAVSSCKRSEVEDPIWDDPAGFYILLEGSAHPAVFFIDGNIHTSQIYVRATDSQGNPLAGRTIFFEQLATSDSHVQVDWGYFENNHLTIQKVTDANGEVRLTFYQPTEFHSGAMVIHAVMQVDGKGYRGSPSHVGSIPQDYIHVTMFASGS